MMQKTYSVTRKKNSKYIKMYKEFIKNQNSYKDNQNSNVLAQLYNPTVPQD
jgi:hypothetical protein